MGLRQVLPRNLPPRCVADGAAAETAGLVESSASGLAAELVRILESHL